MNELLDKQLIECLDALEQGEPLEAVLANYPDTAVQLRPLLETAVQLAQFKIQPSLAAQNRSRQDFMAQATALRGEKNQRAIFLPFAFDWRRIFAPVAALVMTFVIGIGLVNASDSAIPGDALYGAKLVTEGVQLAFTGDPDARAALTRRFHEERIQEIEALLRMGRNAEVVFEGVVGKQQIASWQVAGLDVLLNQQTQIIGQPEVNDWVLVDGRTIQGILLANTITLRQDNPTDETPTPTATELPELPGTATPIPDSEADSPSPTPTQTVTPDPEATPTPDDDTAVTPTSTRTGVTSTPSATSTPDDDNGNTNSNDDNGNDNEGEDDNGNGNDNGDDNGNHNGNDNDDDETPMPTSTGTLQPTTTPIPSSTPMPTSTPDDDDDNDNENDNDDDNDNENDNDDDDDNDNDNGNGSNGSGNGNGNSTP